MLPKDLNGYYFKCFIFDSYIYSHFQVINFTVPAIYSRYVHRVGRTARAGRCGRSVSIVGDKEFKMLKDIRKLSKTALYERVLDKSKSWLYVFFCVCLFIYLFCCSSLLSLWFSITNLNKHWYTPIV